MSANVADINTWLTIPLISSIYVTVHAKKGHIHVK